MTKTDGASFREKMLAIASYDLTLYTKLLQYRDRVGRSEANGLLTARARSRFREAVTYCYESLNREITPQELRYVELRFRHLLPASKAMREAGIARGVSEDVLHLSAPVQHQIKLVRDEIASKIMVTKGDVVQGMLNAVAVAKDSMELVTAWREIGKLLGHYEETKIRIEQSIKQEVNHTHKLEGVDLKVLSDAELMQYAGTELAQRLSAPRTLEHNPLPELKDLAHAYEREIIVEPVPLHRAEPAALRLVDDPDEQAAR